MSHNKPAPNCISRLLRSLALYEGLTLDETSFYKAYKLFIMEANYSVCTTHERVKNLQSFSGLHIILASGVEGLAKAFVTNPNVDVNSQMSFKKDTPLAFAMSTIPIGKDSRAETKVPRQYYYKVLKLLLERGDISSSLNVRNLVLEFRHNEGLWELIDKLAPVIDGYQVSLLEYAVINDLTDIARYLLARDDIEIHGALAIAIFQQREDILNILMNRTEFGTAIQIRDKQGNSLLNHALWPTLSPMATRVLLQHKDIEISQENLFDYYAEDPEHEEETYTSPIIRLLLERILGTDFQHNHDRCARSLIIATEYGLEDIVGRILERCYADISPESFRNAIKPALEVSVRFHYDSLAGLILAKSSLRSKSGQFLGCFGSFGAETTAHNVWSSRYLTIDQKPYRESH
jgi:hypothetical protein